MAIKYTKRTEILCRFRGEDLKEAMEVSGLSVNNLSNAVNVYHSKIKTWMESKMVVVDKALMDEINYILDNPLLIK